MIFASDLEYLRLEIKGRFNSDDTIQGMIDQLVTAARRGISAPTPQGETLVERLLNYRTDDGACADLMDDAATALEQLSAERDRARDSFEAAAKELQREMDNNQKAQARIAELDEEFGAVCSERDVANKRIAELEKQLDQCAGDANRLDSERMQGLARIAELEHQLSKPVDVMRVAQCRERIAELEELLENERAGNRNCHERIESLEGALKFMLEEGWTPEVVAVARAALKEGT